MFTSARRFAVVCILPLVAASAAVQTALDRTDVRRDELATNTLKGIGGVAFDVGTLMMGGLKSLAVIYLWVRYSDLIQDRQWLQAEQYAEIITRMQPRNEEVWSYLVRDLVYNIPANLDDRREKWKYISRGIAMGMEGARWNPLSPFIKYELGFILYHRLEQDPLLVAIYQQERRRSPFTDSRLWFDESMRALDRWMRRQGPEAAYYSPAGVLVSPDTLSNFIRNVSLQEAGWALYTGGDTVTARAALTRALAEVRRQLARGDDRAQQRWRATCEDLLAAVLLEHEAAALLPANPPEYEARLLMAWKAYRQAVLNPDDPAETYRRRDDILYRTFFPEHWAQVGAALGGDRWEPNDMSIYYTPLVVPVRFTATLAPTRDDVDRYLYVSQSRDGVRVTLRYRPGALAPLVRVAVVGAAKSDGSFPEGEVEPARKEAQPREGTIVLDTPPLSPGGEYILEVRNDPAGPWSKAPYEVETSALPAPPGPGAPPPK
jgi:hypothetical protein